MKIAYCLNSVCVYGGVSSVVCAKANELAKIDGNEIYIVVTDHDFDKCPALHNVHLINLDVNIWDNDSISPFYYFSKQARGRRRAHRERLAKTLKYIEPDIVISVGWDEKYIIPRISQDAPWVTIREYHYHRNYRLDFARYTDGLLKRCLVWVRTLIAEFYQRYIYKYRYDCTVLLTWQDLEENWKSHDEKFLSVIPNLSSCAISESIAPGIRKTAVTACRLNKSKQVDHLIQAWQQVSKSHPDWHLEIYGDGPMREELELMIERFQLQNQVSLMGVSYNMKESLARGDFFVFASAFEGFGMVLIEAMSCGLPCIAYACPCGPKDIIKNGENGFLIKLNDVGALAEKIISLIESPVKLSEMKQNALRSAVSYQPAVIVNKWMELFVSLQRRKSCLCANRQ